jgi:hypothetical protein
MGRGGGTACAVSTVTAEGYVFLKKNEGRGKGSSRKEVCITHESLIIEHYLRIAILEKKETQHRTAGLAVTKQEKGKIQNQRKHFCRREGPSYRPESQSQRGQYRRAGAQPWNMVQLGVVPRCR